MGKWVKSPPELVDLFDLLTEPFIALGAERRQMFGCPCLFINNNMFAGLHQYALMVRLPEPDRGRALAEVDEAALFEPMAGRPMKEYVALPAPLEMDPEQFEVWLGRSFAYASSLPVKVKNPKKFKK